MEGLKSSQILLKIGNHTFRATGITAYLKNSGRREVAQHIANHESPLTTKLYDRGRMKSRWTKSADRDLKLFAKPGK